MGTINLLKKNSLDGCLTGREVEEKPLKRNLSKKTRETSRKKPCLRQKETSKNYVCDKNYVCGKKKPLRTTFAGKRR
jgi:hypothetical protein